MAEAMALVREELTELAWELLSMEKLACLASLMLGFQAGSVVAEMLARLEASLSVFQAQSVGEEVLA